MSDEYDEVVESSVYKPIGVVPSPFRYLNSGYMDMEAFREALFGALRVPAHLIDGKNESGETV